MQIIIQTGEKFIFVMCRLHCVDTTTRNGLWSQGKIQLLYTFSGEHLLRWHTDDEPLHFDLRDLDHTFYAILSWSFGATRTFLVKHKRSGRIYHTVLSSGDVVCMNQFFQFQYVHWLVLSFIHDVTKHTLVFRTNPP